MGKYACWILPMRRDDGEFDGDWLEELVHVNGKRTDGDAKDMMFTLVNAKSLNEAKKKWFFNVYANKDNRDVENYKSDIMKWVLTLTENWGEDAADMAKDCNFSIDEAQTIMEIALTYIDQFPQSDNWTSFEEAIKELAPDNWDNGDYPHEKLNALPIDTLLQVWYQDMYCRICVASLEREIK